jgi:hypothetical protein
LEVLHFSTAAPLGATRRTFQPPFTLETLFPRASSAISDFVASALRESLELGHSRGKGSLETIDFVLSEVCRFQTHWKKGPQVESSWTRNDREGRSLRPDRLWSDDHGNTIPVFIDKESRTLGLGKGRRFVSRVLRWLRSGSEKLTLLTNGRQWRILYAGADYEAWCESDSTLWFEDGLPSPQLHALVELFSPRLWTAPKAGARTPLLQAIEDSRKGQADLSSSLGERVRLAVERLIDAHQHAIDELGQDIPPAELYRAAGRVIMRLVVVLFAEARGLLPVDNTVYHSSYGLRGLQDDLRKLARSNRLSASRSAWPRLLALFRLVHHGSAHPDLTVRGYGGELFQPGSETSSDGLIKAIWLFENACFLNERFSIPDSLIQSLVENLTQTREKVRSGSGFMTVPVPVDFSDLSSEYIGILYEGMLDYELKQVPEGEAAVLLPIGQQPILPLSRLEGMSEKQLAELRKEFSKTAKSSSDEGEETSEEQQEEATNDDDPVEELPEEGDPVEAEMAESQPLGGLQSRVASFFAKFVVDAGLVRKPSARATPESRAAHAEEIAKKAAALARTAHYPGKRYLVRWGGTRKGSGSFYTRPGLSGPTVQRTLAPLAYVPPKQADGSENKDAPLTEWTPRLPEEILSVKVCDAACGSGTFPVGGLRFLSQALWDSVHYHNRISPTGDNRTAVSLFGKAGARESLGDEFLPCLPDDETYETRLRARLKRHVAERCIYGVDLDPLAVELCRLALWIETLDPELPFTFLNHKIKCGNGLVGCWFDRFEDYPALALHRPQDDAGDTKTGPLSQALKTVRDATIKPSLAHWLEAQDPGVFSFLKSGPSIAEQHKAVTALFEQLHNFGVHESEERARFYNEKVVPALAPLRAAFDAWCAVWFWPLDKLQLLPTPEQFATPSEASREVIAKTAAQLRFFHWELEFPDVFTAPNSGFSAILGNPPWEVQKPSSKEFFSNYDPLYRTYGKQEALKHQKQLFAADPGIELEWLAYCARFKALSNWCSNAGFPWGDPEDETLGGTKWSLVRGSANADLHSTWRQIRTERRGYADPAHPFRHQGSADLNTYKLFLEQIHALLRPEGRLGVIVPSNVYTDKGSTTLRRLFLEQCQWEWLFSFENREKIFDIDSRFKFAAVIVQKGGETAAIRTAFMRRNLADWAEGERHALDYPRAQVAQFSPKSYAILELRSVKDAQILEKMYANGVLLGDDSEQGWGLKYAREFDMTNDSKLFPPRPWWEEKGYVPDEYGHWLKGGWVPVTGNEPWVSGGDAWLAEHWRRARSILHRPEGLILSRDGTMAMRVEDIEDVALPLYEGRMIDHFDFSSKGWVSGKGRSAVWRDIPWDNKVIEPQYLMGRTITAETMGLKISFLDIGSATNARSMISTIVLGAPCGNVAPVFHRAGSEAETVALSVVLNSCIYDFAVRLRLGGLHLNYFVVEETPLAILRANPALIEASGRIALALNFGTSAAAQVWMSVTSLGANKGSWTSSWASTVAERLRLICQAEAITAYSFGLSLSDVMQLLLDCDHPTSVIRSDEFSRELDPKGFWRVDKEKDPELRHTVLAQVAFADLQSKGLEAFLSQNDGEGWMMPETLRLADYGLGHDERAKEAQPVASRLGPRFYHWQLEGTVEESWEECRRHTDVIGRIRKG